MTQFNPLEEQVEVVVNVGVELARISDMEDEDLVDEIEHVLSVVPDADFEYDLEMIILGFHELGYLTKKERKRLQGSYVLSYVNMSIAQNGEVIIME